jgi:hypothetical protein
MPFAAGQLAVFQGGPSRTGISDERQVNCLADGAELGDAAHEFQELRCPDDRVRNRGSLDEVFLGHFRSEIATRQQAFRADH